MIKEASLKIVFSLLWCVVLLLAHIFCSPIKRSASERENIISLRNDKTYLLSFQYFWKIYSGKIMNGVFYLFPNSVTIYCGRLGPLGADTRIILDLIFSQNIDKQFVYKLYFCVMKKKTEFT